MESVVAFLEAHGLTAAAFAALWGLVKYYVGKDIKETKEGIKNAKQLHTELKAYVETCEDAFERRLESHEREMGLMKQETNHLATDIKNSITRIETTLAEHTRKEESYQRDISNFMGYVYRHIGNGAHPQFGEDK